MNIKQQSERVALITGGAGGIGRQIAEALAYRAGAAVYVVDRNATAAEETAEAICKAGARAAPLVADLADISAVQELLAVATQQFGPPDILVNNAAIAATIAAPDYPLDHWNATLAVNVTAPMLLIQQALKSMKKNHWGRVVNIASISGVRAGTGRLAYGTSKAALIALTKQFAIETAEWGVTVNAVAPGPVETDLVRSLHGSSTRSAYADIVPMRRYGSTQEIANAVLFLASDEASYITGHTLAVDGGFLASGVLIRNLFDMPPAAAGTSSPATA